MIVLALGLAGVLGTARLLEPDPRGFGTHTQLGLAPCAFARITGRPCPTCGMTTAFAWFVALIPWLLAGAAWGRPLGSRSLERPLTGLVVAIVALSLLSWTIRLIFGRAFR